MIYKQHGGVNVTFSISAKHHSWVPNITWGNIFNSFWMLSKYCFNCSLPLLFMKPRAQLSLGIFFMNFLAVRFCYVRYAATIILMSNLSKGKPQSHNVTTRDANNFSSTSLNTAGAPTDFLWMFLSLFWIVRGIPYYFMLYLWIKHPP